MDHNDMANAVGIIHATQFFPCAISVIDGPIPAIRRAGRDTIQNGRTISANPEYGRPRLRIHAPQDVILSDGLNSQVSQEVVLHDVLDPAPSSA